MRVYERRPKKLLPRRWREYPVAMICRNCGTMCGMRYGYAKRPTLRQQMSRRINVNPTDESTLAYFEHKGRAKDLCRAICLLQERMADAQERIVEITKLPGKV